MISQYPDLLSEVRAFRSAHPEVQYVDLICVDIPGHFYGKRYPIEMLEKVAAGSPLKLPQNCVLLGVQGGLHPIGGQVGQTNVVFFTADGQQVASYDIAVKRDLNGMRAALRQSLPGVQIEGVGDSVMLTGSVSSPVEAQQAGVGAMQPDAVHAGGQDGVAPRTVPFRFVHAMGHPAKRVVDFMAFPFTGRVIHQRRLAFKQRSRRALAGER